MCELHRDDRIWLVPKLIWVFCGQCVWSKRSIGSIGVLSIWGAWRLDLDYIAVLFDHDRVDNVLDDDIYYCNGHCTHVNKQQHDLNVDHYRNSTSIKHINDSNDHIDNI